MGIATMQTMTEMGLRDRINCFCDKRAGNLKKIDDIEVITFEKAKEKNLPFIICVGDHNFETFEVIDQMEEGKLEYYLNLDEYIHDVLADKFNKNRLNIIKSKNQQVFNSIKNNAKFHNMHLGERCFVLGNGPSLKDVNFSLLKDEFVFTCNRI